MCISGALVLSLDAAGPDRPARPVLWASPPDVSSRDLYRGPGREPPQGPFTFVNEELDGTNPKFNIRDSRGIEWKVKIGVEAQPEIAASRLLWAVGFYTSEYFFLPTLTVSNMPELKRGQELRGPDGVFYGARLKRDSVHGEKLDTWRWRKNPFVGSREFNGLRVMMAVINNWDLKTENNAVVGMPPENIYMISDLGATFGTSNWIRPLDHAKGNLASYNESEFITKVADDHVDFSIGGRPAIVNAVNLPLYIKYLKMDWIGKHIPRADARWMGNLLSRLSADQIRDAFRAAGYGPHEIEGFTRIILSRIEELRNL